MAEVPIADLKVVRSLLNKSQSELALLLGTSIRAIQSYEQGWRPVPAHIQQKNALLLYLNWRKEGGRGLACWRLRGCSPADKAKCLIQQQRASDLCWLLSGTQSNGHLTQTPEERLTACSACPVMLQWLNHQDMPDDLER